MLCEVHRPPDRAGRTPPSSSLLVQRFLRHHAKIRLMKKSQMTLECIGSLPVWTLYSNTRGFTVHLVARKKSPPLKYLLCVGSRGPIYPHRRTRKASSSCGFFRHLPSTVIYPMTLRFFFSPPHPVPTPPYSFPTNSFQWRNVGVCSFRP